VDNYFQFLADPNSQHAVRMLYARTDEMWIVRKAGEICRMTGCSWPVAQVQAHAAFKALLARPKAPVIPLKEWRVSKQAATG
jgi:hypothetical protein